ncbi:hypothetical protein [Campylobacter sp. US33a]|uniref:Flagellar-associated protein FlgQ n=1 Tax=Campylobacter sp. CCS1377 TaxID=3158229 RepID=A0AAU7E700_9BACT|nr:hypothetical protein [Campylobacter sp. US33a]MCW1360247.1 hypothetical protein [Campylobacter jejuni]TEY02725.1 hypothetical protein ELQ16_04945 [Campylobacter sp. US33a]
MERIICLLIFFFFRLFAQDEFIFWAEFSNKNLILFHQNQNISLAMTRSANVKSELACEIAYNDNDLKILPKTELGLIDDDMSKTIKLDFLNSHKDELLNCFIGAKIKINDYIQSENALANHETYIKILPLRFMVEFGNHFALIYYLHKEK